MILDAKACTKCAAEKPLSEFSKAPRGRLGLKSTCKACDAARHAANFVPAVADPVAQEARYTRQRTGPKTCTKCGATKERTEFYKSRDGKYGPVLKPYCKDCDTAMVREWYGRNTDRSNSNRRRLQLKQLYGLTLADYEDLLSRQGGKCAICLQPENSVHSVRGMPFRLSVDHCHITGVNRGLLCHRCNRAVGLLGDDVAILLRAVDYLRQHGAAG